MNLVISMQDTLLRNFRENDDDLILETHWEPEDVNVELSRLAQVADLEDRTVVVVNFHVVDRTETDCPPASVAGTMGRFGT